MENETVQLKTTNIKKQNADISNHTIQEELHKKAQKIADCMVAKKMRGMPTKEELNRYREWVRNKDLTVQKYHEELCGLQKQMELLHHENKYYRYKMMVIMSDVQLQYVDFVTYELCNKATESQNFAIELHTFLQKNPQYRNNPS